MPINPQLLHKWWIVVWCKLQMPKSERRKPPCDYSLKLTLHLGCSAVFQRLMAIFRVWLGVRSVVNKGRLVMGLERFFVFIQLAIASLSYEYPSVRKHPQDERKVQRKAPRTRSNCNIREEKKEGRSFLTCSNDWILHKLSADGTEELIRNAWTLWLILQLLHFSQELIAKAYGLCRHTHEWENVPEEKTSPSNPCVLSFTQKQSGRQVEQAELAHAEQSVVILAFSTFDSQMANLSVGEADHAITSVKFISKQALACIWILSSNLAA